jgi:hypothetical protein
MAMLSTNYIGLLDFGASFVVLNPIVKPMFMTQLIAMISNTHI